MAWLQYAKFGVDALSSISNFIGGNKNIDKQIKAQKEENEKNRQYNKLLAEQQNKWNVEQWERENLYNTPSNQIKRMKDAGINPDLVYGNGAAQSMSAQSPQMTSGASSSPVDVSALGQKMTMGQAIQQSLNNEMMRAQIEKVKSDTDKTKTETDILSSDSSFRDALNQQQLDFGAIQIDNISQGIVESKQKVKNLRQECQNLKQVGENLKAQFDEIKASIVNLDAATASRKLHDILDSKESKARIEEMAARTHLTNAQANEIITFMAEKMLGMQAQREVLYMQSFKLGYEGDTLQFNLDQANSYQDVERTTNILTDICDTLLPIASLIGVAFGGDYYEDFHETTVHKDGKISEKYSSKKKGVKRK